jgi:hypothetical protein
MKISKVLPIAAVGTLLMLILSFESAWAANGDVQAQCGSIKSYTAPATSTAGSIVIGSRTFQVQRQSTAIIGSHVCLVGPVLASYIFDGFTASAIPGQHCGTINSVFLPTVATAGLISIGRDPEFVFKLPSGGSVPAGTEGTSQCLTIGLDAQGDAIVIAFARSTAVSLGTLPSTSTRPSPNPSDATTLLMVGLAAVLAGVALVGFAQRALAEPVQT